MSKLFDDASLAMIPSAYKDGRLYSIRPIPELGSELNPNVDFSSDTNWTHTRGNWAISGGTLNTSSETDYCFVDIGDQSSKTLRIEFDIVSHSSGSVQVRLFGATTKYGIARNAVGTYVEYIDVPAGHNGSIGFQGGSSFTGAIDNVSFKVVSNNGDFTFSRGSNLAATRVDVNGLIEKGRENLLLQSNQFDTTWVEAGNSGIITSGFAGYDGTNDAWQLEHKGSQYTSIRQTLSSSGVQTYSLYAKAGTLDYVIVYAQSSVSPRTWFNLSNGTIGSQQGSTIDASIESVGSGWYRCTISFSDTLGGVRIYPNDGNGTFGTTSGTIYIQDAQLEQGLVATDYIETGASTAQAGILEDMPRLDYSGGASCPSLLLEPQRTNLYLFSEQIDNAYWTKTNSTITANSVTSPDGYTNADTLTASGSGSVSHLVARVITTTSGSVYAFSVFAKKGNTDFIALRHDSGGTFNYFNINTGTKGATCDASATIEDYGNGWYRCTVLHTATGSNGGEIYLATANGVTSFAAAGEFAYIYGAQYELGSYPTSYIPTYGTSQTRTADASSLGSLQSNSIINGSTATLLFEGLKNGEPIFSNFVITANNNTNKSLLIDNSAGGIRLRVFNASSGQDATLTTSAVSDGAFKYLIRWDNGELKVFLNGSSVGTATISAYEYISAILREGSWSNNTIKQFLIFPTALTDSECIALTTL